MKRDTSRHQRQASLPKLRRVPDIFLRRLQILVRRTGPDMAPLSLATISLGQTAWTEEANQTSISGSFSPNCDTEERRETPPCFRGDQKTRTARRDCQSAASGEAGIDLALQDARSDLEPLLYGTLTKSMPSSLAAEPEGAMVGLSCRCR